LHGAGRGRRCFFFTQSALDRPCMAPEIYSRTLRQSLRCGLAGGTGCAAGGLSDFGEDAAVVEMSAAKRGKEPAALPQT
jgi:hypothetical protein